jgi:4-hydroxy-tetrahydrodipicolinate synthase
MLKPDLAGVFAASLTPLNPDFSPDLSALESLLDFLAGRGCHGALLLGTTGEGPSFNPEQRLAILRAAVQGRPRHLPFRLLGGTGTPSLSETISLTRAAFELGLDGVVVLPPYYFRKASDEGLYAWFSEVLRQAVPPGGALLGYNIPNLTGIGFSLDLLTRLKEAYPDRFAGIKDSSGDPEYARQLGARFGRELTVLTGNDHLFSLALACGASGCITAPANLFSAELRRIWDAFQAGSPDEAAQERVKQVRARLEKFPPFPPLLKALIARCHGFPRWPVCPPLTPLSLEAEEQALAELGFA